MSDDDIHLREKLVQPGLSQEEDRIHSQAMDYLKKSAGKGTSWQKVCDGLKIADAELKKIILDDFVKITIAERHFQGSVGLKQISKDLAIPMDVLVKAKEEMFAEVQAVSLQAYHLTRKPGETKH
ncbi:MAG: hypothetical protein G8345_11370 [Magnetococcales bacterium]|nr:hypothetical protein [Magnetococcales bacterium]NGZ27473.1 hypothetical protein [Magnetococcales bacterium]